MYIHSQLHSPQSKHVPLDLCLCKQCWNLHMIDKGKKHPYLVSKINLQSDLASSTTMALAFAA